MATFGILVVYARMPQLLRPSPLEDGRMRHGNLAFLGELSASAFDGWICIR